MSLQTNYTEEDVLALTQEPKLSHNFVGQFVVTGVTGGAHDEEFRGISKTGRPMVRARLQAIDTNTGEPSNLGATHFVLIPGQLTPEKVMEAVNAGKEIELAGNEPPKPSKGIVDKFRRFYNAAFPGVLPSYPQWDRDAKTYSIDGEVVDKATAEARKVEVTNAVLAAATELYEDPDTLLGTTFYARVFTEDKEGNTMDFPNFVTFSSTPIESVE